MFDETGVLSQDATMQLPVVRRKLKGLRLPVLPSWPLVAQVLGGAGVLGGVYLKLGLAITLIVGGVAAVAVGMLREGGKI
jgi:hypothetical protein